MDELNHVTLDPRRMHNTVSATVAILVIGAIIGAIFGVFFSILIWMATAPVGGIAYMFALPMVLATAGVQIATAIALAPVWAVVVGWIFAQLSVGGGGSAARAMGVELLPHDHDIVVRVHKMCKELEIPPVPYVGYFDSKAINAFAIGTSQHNAMIAFSKGCLAKMTGEQFMAVMGHELGHVANRDMLRMTYARGIQNALTFFLVIRRLKVMARWVFTFISELEIMRLSRKREFYADAVGAMLVSPEDMIGALEAVREDKYSPSRKSRQFTNLMFRGSIDQLFSTHPPLSQRIKALESREYIHRLPIKSVLLEAD